MSVENGEPSAFAIYSEKKRKSTDQLNHKKQKKHFSTSAGGPNTLPKSINLDEISIPEQSKQSPISKLGRRKSNRLILSNNEANSVLVSTSTLKIKQENTEKNVSDKLSTKERKKLKRKQEAQKRSVGTKAEVITAAGQRCSTAKQRFANDGTSVESVTETSPHTDVVNVDPVIETRKMFEWLIYPLSISDFFKDNWENSPVQIKRNNANYYKLLMTTPMLDKVLRDHHILFTKNIDITSYSDGVRETHNPEGRAVPSVVWDYYMNGCSVRMLNPQTFIPKLRTLNATLQEFFGCFVGANSYLTPPNSQGFAPHYDDIEAFILQIEGKKRWRLYKPRNDSEYLPRYSSKNFEPSDIGEPILDTIVNAGDLLYFPRGTIHQGETIDDKHSLHITLSVYQKNCWGDFLERLLPDALKQAIESDSEFREGLPLNYLQYTGVVHSENASYLRASFMEKTKKLLSKVLEYIDIDKASDSLGKNHVHDCLPPALNAHEQKCSVSLDGERMVADGVIENLVDIELTTSIRLIRSHCIRLVKESDTRYKCYYSCENSLEYHEYESQFVEVDEQFVRAIKKIILRYPKYILVKELPIDGEANKLQLAKDLWEKGIIITDQPLRASK